MKQTEILYNGDTFELSGLTFKVEFPRDEFYREPWSEEDGHGPVSDWTTRDKAPGERVLISDRSRKRYYDYAEAVKIALKDCWGVEHPEGKTKRQIAAEAVELDYKRLKDWCEDKWTYVGVAVTLLDADGDETKERESLWGIESDSEDYLSDTARELADEIVSRMEGKDAICTPIRKSVNAG